jgi:hypothetical protein
MCDVCELSLHTVQSRVTISLTIGFLVPKTSFSLQLATAKELEKDDERNLGFISII